MIKNITVLLFIISLSGFSQNSNKKTVYYFQDNAITKAEFESLDSRKIFTKKIENDSSIINNIYLRKNVGKLDTIQHHQLTVILKKIIGAEYNQEKKTMIHLYAANDRNIYKDAKNKNYWNWIKNHSNEYQSFLIGTKESSIKPNKRKQIYIDSSNILENLFFQKSDFKLNHLFIKPNGEIYVYFGIDDILNVLDWSMD